jgi:hypothetical protein
MRLFPALALILAAPAGAEAPPPLIAALSGDWDGNEAQEAVVLVPGIEGDADLVVYDNDGFSGLTPVLVLEGVVFAGPMAGQAPSLAPHGAGGFVLSSEQTAVGRTPWLQAVTVLWRDGGFVVAGYDYSFYDRLDLSHYGQCSVNLLTRRYTLTHGPGDEAPEVIREGATEAAAFPLADLRPGFMAAPCGDLYD